MDAWRDRGFLGVKIAAPWGVESGRDGIKKMEKLIAKLRKELGDDMEIMIDCYLSWDIEFATRVAERVRDYDVKWFEDPLQNGWATESNRILRDRISPILLATGNLEYHYQGVSRHHSQSRHRHHPAGDAMVRRLHAHALDRRDGQALRHAGHSRTARRVYNYHFVMANTNSPYAEYLSVGKGTEIQPIFSVLEGEPLPVNGKISLDPNKPGFGVELKRELLRSVRKLKI